MDHRRLRGDAVLPARMRGEVQRVAASVERVVRMDRAAANEGAPPCLVGPVRIFRKFGWRGNLRQAAPLRSHESPRLSRRLQTLRGWSHEQQIDKVRTRGA